jgi:hypothetical protein
MEAMAAALEALLVGKAEVDMVASLRVVMGEVIHPPQAVMALTILS